MLLPFRVIRFGFLGLFILVPLTVVPYTTELFEFNKIIVTYAFTLLIVTAWIARCILESRLVFRRTLLDIPLLLFLLSILLSLLLSLDPRTSFFGYYGRFNGGLLSLLSYSLLYWAFVSNMDQRSALSVIRFTLATAGVVSAYGIAQAFGIDDHLWVQDVKNRVFSSLGQPNWLAAYLVALIFLPISQIPSEKNPKKLIFLYSSTLLLFITLLLTKSRSGLLAFGLSWIVYWGLTVKSSGITILKKSSVIGLWLAVIAASLVIKNPVRDLILPQAPETTAGPALETGGTESGVIRQIVWKGAVNIWKSSAQTFWLGTGPETFAASYFRFRPQEHNQTSEWEFLYNKAHNEFLNFLATTGLVGLGSYLLLLLFMARLLTRPQATSHPLHPALFAGWLSLSVTNFWGFSVVPSQLLLFLLPALAVSLNSSPPPASKPSPLTQKQIFLLLICASAFSFSAFRLLRYWLADVRLASSQKSLAAFSATSEPAYVVDAYNSASAAYDLNPAEPGIGLALAETAAYLAIFTADTDAMASAQLTDLANSVSQNAIAASPSHPSHYRAQSRIFILLSALDQKYLDLADAALAKAADLSPTDPRIPYNRAVIAKYQNDPAKTRQFLDSALSLKPDFPDALNMLEELEVK